MTDLPVVDEFHRLLGIVTVDDVLDALVAEHMRPHLRRSALRCPTAAIDGTMRKNAALA